MNPFVCSRNALLLVCIPTWATRAVLQHVRAAKRNTRQQYKYTVSILIRLAALSRNIHYSGRTALPVQPNIYILA